MKKKGLEGKLSTLEEENAKKDKLLERFRTENQELGQDFDTYSALLKRSQMTLMDFLQNAESKKRLEQSDLFQQLNIEREINRSLSEENSNMKEKMLQLLGVSHSVINLAVSSVEEREDWENSTAYYSTNS